MEGFENHTNDFLAAVAVELDPRHRLGPPDADDNLILRLVSRFAQEECVRIGAQGGAGAEEFCDNGDGSGTSNRDHCNRPAAGRRETGGMVRTRLYRFSLDHCWGSAQSGRVSAVRRIPSRVSWGMYWISDS